MLDLWKDEFDTDSSSDDSEILQRAKEQEILEMCRKPDKNRDRSSTKVSITPGVSKKATKGLTGSHKRKSTHLSDQKHQEKMKKTSSTNWSK